MKKSIQISIPTPCHENWAAMTPTDKGRFCASCQKKVRDFTKSSDREIAHVLNKEGKLCGRFRASQLERELYVPKEKSKLWVAASAAAITLLTVGVNEVSAQTPVKTEQYDAKDRENSKTDLLNGHIIYGTVVDENNFPIPGAIVKVKGANRTAQTDFDGIYSIEAENGQILEFYYIGMKTETMKVSKMKQIDVKMSNDIFMGEVIVEYKKLRISVASQYMFDY